MIPDVNGKWYHGSPLVLTDLLVGSTITQNRELARVFSHKPKVVSIDDDGHIMHNGDKPGFLYEIVESVSLEDVVSHPRTTMRPGDEWLITRSLKVKLLCETRSLAEEFISEEDIAMLKTSGRINK